MLGKFVNNHQKLKRFEDLTTQIYKDLFRFIYNILGNKPATEDALQNTLLSAYNHFGNLKDINRFKSWMFTIAKREALSVIRKMKKESPEDENQLEQKLNTKNDFQVPDDILIDNELKETVISAINTLNSEIRRVMLLRYYNEMSFEEIAKITGVNVNTVRTWHMRAKIKIKEYLANFYKNDSRTEGSDKK